MNVLKFIAIKTDKGYYITDNIKDDRYYREAIERLKFDGEKPKGTFHKSWFIIKKNPKIITQEENQSDINRRYELRDKEQFPKLREVIKEEDALTKKSPDDNDYRDKWSKTFAEIQSLYDFKSDPQAPLDVPIEFEFEIIGEMKSIPGNTPFAYEVQRTQYESEGLEILRNNNVTRNLLDKIATPAILLHTVPCCLTSHETFKIIRQYVKMNFDPTVAVITSDHNFCFAVEKAIKFAEGERYTIDKNLFTKRKPKYEMRYRDARKVRIFEMTWSPECYGDYTPIKGFEGKNEKELKENVERYLKVLIKMINEPLVTCTHCKGRGVILKEGEKENE